MTQQRTHPTVIYDSNELIRALLTQANERQPLAREILRECIESAKQRLLKTRRNERRPGMTNFFSGERIEWSWQKRQGGAIEQSIFVAALTYADIARNSAPPMMLCSRNRD